MELDLIGAQPALFKLYTQLAFIFHVPETVAHATIVSTLTSGLDRLAKAFPWIAGQVVNTSPELDGSPSYKIRPLGPVPRLTVKNYESDVSIPTLAQMKEVGYPMSMLDEYVWAPCPTIASSSFDHSKPSGMGNEPAPVMLVQVSMIRGGLVLYINMQHNVCDMMGQAAVMAWLSKVCRREEFTKDELGMGNADRRAMISPTSGEAADIQGDLEDQMLPIQQASGDTKAPTPNVATPIYASPPCSWTYFTFTSSSLQILKDVATTELPEGSTAFISTDDALSAFIFKSVLRARSYRLPSDTRVTLARAVDARRYLDIQADYPGILQNMTYTSYSLSELMTIPLGHIAAALRRRVDPKTSNVARRTRSLITFC